MTVRITGTLALAAHLRTGVIMRFGESIPRSIAIDYAQAVSALESGLDSSVWVCSEELHRAEGMRALDRAHALTAPNKKAPSRTRVPA